MGNLNAVLSRSISEVDRAINAFGGQYYQSKASRYRMCQELEAIGTRVLGVMDDERLHEWLTLCMHGKVKDAWSVAFDYVSSRNRKTSTV